jgi:polyisoprenoid-binding protein YceI
MLGLAAVVLLAGPAAADTKYTLTGENTKIEFTGTKPDGKHDGGFKTLSGTASVDGGAIAIAVEIDTDSLYSDDPRLTGHLKAPDFFSVKEHPKAKFESTKVEKGEKGYTVTGNLTLLGKTKPVSFPAEIQAGDTFTLKAEFKIDRTEFGMVYGKGKVADEVAVRVSVAAKK